MNNNDGPQARRMLEDDKNTNIEMVQGGFGGHSSL